MRDPCDPWLTIIGIGEDGLSGLSDASRKALARAETVFGGERHLALHDPHQLRKCFRCTHNLSLASRRPLTSQRRSSTTWLQIFRLSGLRQPEACGLRSGLPRVPPASPIARPSAAELGPTLDEPLSQAQTKRKGTTLPVHSGHLRQHVRFLVRSHRRIPSTRHRLRRKHR